MPESELSEDLKKLCEVENEKEAQIEKEDEARRNTVRIDAYFFDPNQKYSESTVSIQVR